MPERQDVRDGNKDTKLPCSIQVVQQFAGHSNIATTRKYYLTVRPEDITSANKIMNQILKAASKD